jgi:hypothetical protein
MLQVIGDQYVDRLLEAAVTQIMPAAGLDVMVHAKYEAGNAESAKAAVRTIKVWLHNSLANVCNFDANFFEVLPPAFQEFKAICIDGEDA